MFKCLLRRFSSNFQQWRSDGSPSTNIVDTSIFLYFPVVSLTFSKHNQSILSFRFLFYYWSRLQPSNQNTIFRIVTLCISFQQLKQYFLVYKYKVSLDVVPLEGTLFSHFILQPTFLFVVLNYTACGVFQFVDIFIHVCLVLGLIKFCLDVSWGQWLSI